MGIGSDPCNPSTRWGVVDCVLAGAAAERYEDGESTVVGGVSWLVELFMAAGTLGRVGALETEEELALVRELAEPAALGVSPRIDSVSSVAGWAASGPVPFGRGFDAVPWTDPCSSV